MGAVVRKAFREHGVPRYFMTGNERMFVSRRVRGFLVDIGVVPVIAKAA